MLGATKVIWVPTGLVEDNGTFGARSRSTFRFPTRRHSYPACRRLHPVHDQRAKRRIYPFCRAKQGRAGRSGGITSLRRKRRSTQLAGWFEQQNAERLQRVYQIISQGDDRVGRADRGRAHPAANADFEVFKPGDGTYDYYAEYDRWEDGSTLPPLMLAVWPASYVNYVPTNDLVLIPHFWKPGRPHELNSETRRTRGDTRAVSGRKVVQVFAENCAGRRRDELHHQQQPASARFADLCGWARVRVDAQEAKLYAAPTGKRAWIPSRG